MGWHDMSHFFLLHPTLKSQAVLMHCLRVAWYVTFLSIARQAVSLVVSQLSLVFSGSTIAAVLFPPNLCRPWKFICNNCTQKLKTTYHLDLLSIHNHWDMPSISFLLKSIIISLGLLTFNCRSFHHSHKLSISARYRTSSLFLILSTKVVLSVNVMTWIPHNKQLNQSYTW